LRRCFQSESCLKTNIRGNEEKEWMESRGMSEQRRNSKRKGEFWGENTNFWWFWTIWGETMKDKEWKKE
jgi:hypothetical protein